MTLPWAHTLITLTAIITGGVLLRLFQEKLTLEPAEKIGLGIGGFCGAMIGAKLPFVLYEWPDLLSGAVWFAHGKTIIAGLIGGYLGVELAKWVMDIRIRTGDSYVVPVAVAIAIGRWGCLAAGCCFGAECTLPWAMRFVHAPGGMEILRHPTQIYESLFHLCCAAVFFLLGRQQVCRGQLFKLYLIAYLAFRFLTEWIRPEPEFALGLTAYQWAAAAAILVFAVLVWRDQRNRAAEQPKSVNDFAE